ARAGRRVKILVPQRGEKRGFVDLANRNAALAYQTRFNQARAAQYDALETLQHVLNLPTLPRRIECFDISTIQGSETVASMVVCDDGRMRRADYRKFRSRSRWPPTIRRCSSSSGFATKRIASRSRSIGGRDRCAICDRSSITFRASERGGARRCSPRSAAWPASGARHVKSWPRWSARKQ